MRRRLTLLVWSVMLVALFASPPSSLAQVDRDCGDFTTQQQAQDYFRSRGGSARNNVDNLDADHDGIACETLPHGAASTNDTRTTSTTSTTRSSTRTSLAPRTAADEGGLSAGAVLFWVVVGATVVGIVVKVANTDRHPTPTPHPSTMVAVGRPVTPRAGSIRGPGEPSPRSASGVETDCVRSVPAVASSDVRTLRTMPYADYLQTGHWQRTRAAALERAGHRCQLCNRPQHLNVHHRTYERRGAERDDDLIVLCRGCHETFHRHRGMPMS